MAIGILGQTGQTAELTVTRDRLIEMAHDVIGVLEPGQALDAEQLRDGIDFLGLIVRETDDSGKWLWTVGEATHLTLLAGVFRYDANSGLPANISNIETMFFRDTSGVDTPVELIQSDQYEAIASKLEVGTPLIGYLTDDRDLSRRALLLCPMLDAVTAGGQVYGDDNNSYKCIMPHAASATNRPLTGPNWPMVWALGGTAAASDLWVSGTSYFNTEQLRLTFRRPLFDFVNAEDVPDFPLSWPRVILYKLAFDLGDIYGIPVEERNQMVAKAKGAFADIFPSTKSKSKKIHNKVSYF